MGFEIENGTLKKYHEEEGVTNITVPDGVTHIGSGAFSWCEHITSVTLPDSVTAIGEGAFVFCENLTNVTFGRGVTEIGESAFYQCEALASVTLPDSIQRIGDSAFTGCRSLADSQGFVIIRDTLYACYQEEHHHIVIPDGVKVIEGKAFCECDNLTYLTIPDSVETIKPGAFDRCKGLADKNGFVIVRGVLHAYYGQAAHVRIPDHVMCISDRVFANNTKLKTVAIPDSVTQIGTAAFSHCVKLASVTPLTNVTHIGSMAFEKMAVAIPSALDGGLRLPKA